MAAMADSFTNLERVVLSQVLAIEAFSGEPTCCSTKARKCAASALEFALGAMAS